MPSPWKIIASSLLFLTLTSSVNTKGAVSSQGQIQKSYNSFLIKSAEDYYKVDNWDSVLWCYAQVYKNLTTNNPDHLFANLDKAAFNDESVNARTKLFMAITAINEESFVNAYEWYGQLNHYQKNAEPTNRLDVFRYFNQEEARLSTTGDLEHLVKLKIQLSIAQFHLFGFEKAWPTAEKALDLALQHLGEMDTVTASAYFNCGYMLHRYDLRSFNEGIMYDQEMAVWRKNLASNTEAYLQKSLSIRQELKGEQNVSVGRSHQALGQHYHTIKKPYLALRHYTSAFNVYSNNLPLWIEHELYYNLGYTSELLGLYDQALFYYLNYCDSNYSTDMIHNRIGNVYLYQGNYDRASEFFTSAKNIWENGMDKTPHYRKHMGSAYDNLGLVCFYKGEYEKAVDYFKKSTTVWIEWYGENHWDVALSYQQTGRALMKLRKYEEAIFFHEKALQMRKELLDENDGDIGLSHYYLGELYILNKQEDQGVKHYRSAITITERAFGKHHPVLSQSQIGMASFFIQNSDWERAENLLLQTISFQNKNENEIGIDHQSYYSPVVALQAIIVLTELQYKWSKELSSQQLKTKKLKSALTLCKSAISLEQKIRSGYPSSEDKMILGAASRQLYDRSVEICINLYEATKDETFARQAFSISEQQRARTLHEAMAKASLSQAVPQEVTQKERDLLAQINLAEIQLEKMKSEPGYSESVIQEIQSAVFDLKKEYDELIAEMETDYANYYQLKHDYSVAGIKQVQQSLEDEQTLALTYHANKDCFYVFAIRKNDFNVYKAPINSDFTSRFSSLLSKARNRNLALNQMNDAKEIEAFQKESHYVYHSLLAHFVKTGPGTISKLILVTDGMLNYLPFEMLIDKWTENATDYNQLQYTIHSYTIRYEYSLTSMVSLKPNETEGQNSFFGGFAPSYGETKNSQTAFTNEVTTRDLLSDLAYNQTEVKAISELIKWRFIFRFGCKQRNISKTVRDV